MEIAKLSASNAEQYYYEKDAIFNENGDGANLEAHGFMAEAFGLQEGETIDKDKFSAIMNGETEDGNSYVSSNRKTAAFDMPLAAPKGVSVLALNGDDDLMKAHDKAVMSVVNKLNEEYAKVQGKDEFGKSVSKEGSGLMIATAKHGTARAGSKGVEDPHLHTHVVIANSTFDKESGKMKALDAKDLFKDQKKLELMYKTELAKAVQKLGYKLEERKGGNFDIAINDKVRDQFSSRHNDIKNEAKGMKEDGKEGSDRALESYAQHNNKNSKTDNTADDLRESWNEQLQSHGYKDFKELAQSAKMTHEEKVERAYFKDEGEALKYAAKALNENEATFSKEELLKAASTVSYGQFSYNDLEKDLNTVKKTGQKEDGDLKKLDDGNFTTKGMNDTEKDNLKMLREGKEFEPMMSLAKANKAIKAFEDKKGFNMTEGQRNMTRELLTSKDQFISIQGGAGAGKTTALEAIQLAAEIEGIVKDANLKVLAPSGKAALGAQEDSGIEGSTVAKFLMQNGGNEKSGQKVAAEQIKGLKRKDFDSYVSTGGAAFKKGKGKSWTVDPSDKNGFRTNKDGDKIAFTKSGGYNKRTKTFKSSNRERVVSGKDKGAVRDIKFTAKGDRKETDIKTQLTDGTKIHTNIKVTSNSSVSQTLRVKDGKIEKQKEIKKDGVFGKTSHKIVEKNGKTTEDKSRSMFLGAFKTKTTSTTIKNKDGDIIGKSVTRERRIMGYTFGKTEYADTKTGKAEQISFQRDSKGNVSDVKVLDRKEGVTGISKKTSEKVDKKLDTDHIRMVKASGMLIVDESSMMGAKDANAILRIAKENNLRVAFVGDIKQLKSVAAGEFFSDLQKVKGDKTVILDKSLRQQNDLQKNIAKSASEGKMSKSIGLMATNDEDGEKILSNGKSKTGKSSLVTESKDKAELIDKMATKIANDPSILGIASTNKDTRALNQAIRVKNGNADKDGLKGATITAKKNLSATKQAISKNYEKDMLVSSYKGIKGMKEIEYKVTGTNDIKNTVKMEGRYFDEKSKKMKTHNIEINAKKLMGNIQTGQKEKRDFVEGDKIIFTRNSDEIGVKNGQIGKVLEVNKKTNSMRIDLGKNKTVNINLNEYKNVDYGNAVSVHASQGVTFSKVAILLNTENGGMNNSNSAYVALSRQKDRVELFTDDSKKLVEQISKEETKTTSLSDKDWSKIANSDEGLDKFTAGSSAAANKDEVVKDVSKDVKSEGSSKDTHQEEVESDKTSFNDVKEETKEVERSQ